jgi:LmbE family N-acetylglucosaminyl deacetylase
MRDLTLAADAGTPIRVLCLGAHADDIEIGCGGLLLDLVQRHRLIDVSWVVFSATSVRAKEAQASARLFLAGAKSKKVTIHRFRDGFFPYDGAKVKKSFETLKRSIPAPDLVLTHYRDDRHQDHRTISDLTWNIFRDHFVLEYEVPKFDGDLGTPNCFVPLSRALAVRKTEHLDQAFTTQTDRHWFSAETFLGLMRLRGVECRAPEGYAEAFYARKARLTL